MEKICKNCIHYQKGEILEPAFDSYNAEVHICNIIRNEIEIDGDGDGVDGIGVYPDFGCIKFEKGGE